MDLIVDSTPVSPFQMNAWVCGDPANGDGVLIDAGADPEKLLAMIDRNNLNIHAILQTHAHLDHAGALKPLKDGLLDRPIYVHPEEMPIYDTVALSAQFFGLGSVPQPPPPDHFIADDDILVFGSLSARVIFLPGHTPGGVAYARSPVVEHFASRVVCFISYQGIFVSAPGSYVYELIDTFSFFMFFISVTLPGFVISSALPFLHGLHPRMLLVNVVVYQIVLVLVLLSVPLAMLTSRSRGVKDWHKVWLISYASARRAVSIKIKCLCWRV